MQSVGRSGVEPDVLLLISLQVKVRGDQGHAGTVPMTMRKDPMIAAAQGIVAVENICTHPEKAVAGSRGATAMSTAVNHAGAIVCTVGEIHSWPGASNVIPGEVIVHIRPGRCSCVLT